MSQQLAYLFTIILFFAVVAMLPEDILSPKKMFQDMIKRMVITKTDIVKFVRKTSTYSIAASLILISISIPILFIMALIKYLFF